MDRSVPRVKNKQAAPVQISAEQLLREAVDRQETGVQAPTQRFADLEELHAFQARKRTEFENYIRRNRLSLKNWTQYAEFELSQNQYARARSVFERALDNMPQDVRLWLRYVDSELVRGNINHGRNLLDRAVTILPRVDKLWYKYVHAEQVLGNIPGARQVFERWISWRPDESAWSQYIKLEKTYNEIDNCRNIFRRFVAYHPEPKNWLKFARFEQEYGTTEDVRQVLGEAIETLSEYIEEYPDIEKLFIFYARHEAQLKEYERARSIYKFALDRLPRSRSMNLYSAYTTFEKQFGDSDGVENVILSKRRVHYEELVKENPRNYDAWIDYANLETAGGNHERVRDVYERAIAAVPPSQQKRHWRRYIYLWIFFALWAEMDAKDVSLAGQIWDECIKLIPHTQFTFAKVWILKSQFHIRQMDLQAARKTLGRAIGQCPKDKLFSAYEQTELKLFEFSRCRILYEKHVQWNPSNTQAWMKFAELERGLDDLDRSRAIYELAISQPTLDMPELLWKSYIDFEEEEGEYDNARRLYERLLERTNHVKVWIAYARFELNVPDEDVAGEDEDAEQPISEASKTRARTIFDRAHKTFKSNDLKEERVAILEAWKKFEEEIGSPEDLEKVAAQMPRKVKKRRKVDDGSFEEYMDYVFPGDDEGQKKMSKLLEMAHKWKREQQEKEAAAMIEGLGNGDAGENEEDGEDGEHGDD